MVIFQVCNFRSTSLLRAFGKFLLVQVSQRLEVHAKCLPLLLEIPSAVVGLREVIQG